MESSKGKINKIRKSYLSNISNMQFLKNYINSRQLGPSSSFKNSRETNIHLQASNENQNQMLQDHIFMHLGGPSDGSSPVL